MSTQYTRKLIQTLFVLLTILGLFSSLSGLIVIAFALLAGPVFCGWICPFGFVQDLFTNLRSLLGIKKLYPIGYHFFSYGRYVFLALSLFNISVTLHNLYIADPRTIFQQLLTSGTLSTLNISLLTVFLVASLFIDRFFCRYLCPEGARHSIISMGRLFKVTRTSKCVDCGKCDHICPMGVQITKETRVNDINCISCMECINACPVDKAISIKMSLQKRKLLLSGVLSIALVIVPMIQLHTAVVMAQPMDASTLTVNQTLHEGVAKGFKSTIHVQVLKTSDHIDNILIINQNDDAKWFNSAMSVIDKMIATQSTDVDTVSGATYSSQGIINATKAALGESFQEQAAPRGHGRHH